MLLLYGFLVGIPSLLLASVVCCLLYLGVKSLRRGQIAYSTVMLIVALAPFLLFAVRIVQANKTDSEHARFIASIAKTKTGPVTGYPNVLVVARHASRMSKFYLNDLAFAADLILDAGFREVDMIDTLSDSTTTSLSLRPSVVGSGSKPRSQGTIFSVILSSVPRIWSGASASSQETREREALLSFY